ncbi:unnamed protein product [Paramecium primaurelia]|uniref:Uncharacterized protein n=1 Tax=Paramecium primaurelia TaxID=5886 RepID=A0A8S1N9N6_PARPR|nr:unnamed protein product [Paramecium primaurelia]
MELNLKKFTMIRKIQLLYLHFKLQVQRILLTQNQLFKQQNI